MAIRGSEILRSTSSSGRERWRSTRSDPVDIVRCHGSSPPEMRRKNDEPADSFVLISLPGDVVRRSAESPRLKNDSCPGLTTLTQRAMTGLRAIFAHLNHLRSDANGFEWLKAGRHAERRCGKRGSRVWGVEFGRRSWPTAWVRPPGSQEWPGCPQERLGSKHRRRKGFPTFRSLKTILGLCAEHRLIIALTARPSTAIEWTAVRVTRPAAPIPPLRRRADGVFSAQSNGAKHVRDRFASEALGVQEKDFPVSVQELRRPDRS